jgi:hypothetical protein
LRMSTEKTRKMCKMRKNVEQRMDEIAALVREPRYVCTKCARVANTADALCHPMKHPEGSELRRGASDALSTENR